MYRKLVLLLGSVAVIASLMLMPPTYEENTLNPNYNPNKAGWGNNQYDTQIKKDYGKLSSRTIAIAVGFGALYFVVPNKREKTMEG